MTGSERDLIRDYFRDGPEELPERVYLSMRGAIETVAQRRRRPWPGVGSWLREPRVRLAVIAAVIVAALLATWRLLPNPTIYGPGGASPSPTAEPSPLPSGVPLATTIGDCTLTLTELREVRGGDPEAPTPFLMSPPYRAAMLPHTGQPSAALIQADGTGWGVDGPGRPVVSVVRPDATLDYPGVSLDAGRLSTSYAFDVPGTWTLSIVAESVACTQVVAIIIDPEPSPTPPPSAQLEPSP
ncbi:MAG TPA: hypothetical protein VFC71_02285 [Candidatus Polarisedimenticolia bacterium]|nr:hypothetical protein [Candidatus Polarisedimenticolia bacterium]